MKQTKQRQIEKLESRVFPVNYEDDERYDSVSDRAMRRRGEIPAAGDAARISEYRNMLLRIGRFQRGGCFRVTTRLVAEKLIEYKESTKQKQVLYIDMDNVVVDFPSGIAQISEELQKEYEGRLDEVPGIFSLMKPMEDAIKSIELLDQFYEIYFLSTAPWENPSAWSDKLQWIKQYFPTIGYKRLILSHNKHLNQGDYLVDDRLANGADRFKGEHVHFGTEQFPCWQIVEAYLLSELPVFK